MLVAALATVAVGVAPPMPPLADVIGFAHLRWTFLAPLAGMVVG